MERHAFAMKVKAGRMNDYRKKLGRDLAGTDRFS